MDARYIGTFAEDGRVETYPSVDLSGAACDVPPLGTRGIDARHFVALPVGGDWSVQYGEACAFVQASAPPTNEDRGDSAPRKSGKRAPTETAPVEAAEGE